MRSLSLRNPLCALAMAVITATAAVALPAAPASAATSVRLMTYNIEHLVSTSGALGPIADDIAASGASIVALQETKQTDGDVSDAQKLVDLLGWGGDGAQHSYFAGWHDPGTTNWCNGTSCTEGNAIISEFPIVGTGVVPLVHEDGTLNRNLIRVTVQVDAATQLRVYSTHLASVNSAADETYAVQQLNGIATHIDSTTPTQQYVLMGDFNLTWDTAHVTTRQDFASLTSRGYHDWKADRISLSNPCAGPYYACTYPAANPTDKRDYIWSHGYTMTAGSRIDNCASTCTSDHRGYWTTISV